MDFRKLGFGFLVMSVLLVIGMSVSVSALSVGIAGDVEAYPGQTLDRVFDIQNLLDNARDVTLEGSFLEGGEVISFSEGNTFVVPAGSVIPVPVRISIPDDAAIGTEYNVRVLFESTTGGAGDGSVAFAANVGRIFVVRVAEQPATPDAVEPTATEQEGGFGGGLIWFIVAALLVIVIIVFFVMRAKNASASTSVATTDSSDSKDASDKQ